MQLSVSENHKLAPFIYLSKFLFVDGFIYLKNWKIAPRCIERFKTETVYISYLKCIRLHKVLRNFHG